MATKDNFATKSKKLFFAYFAFLRRRSGLVFEVRGIPLKILMVADEKPDWDFIAQPV